MSKLNTLLLNKPMKFVRFTSPKSIENVKRVRVFLKIALSMCFGISLLYALVTIGFFHHSFNIPRLRLVEVQKDLAKDSLQWIVRIKLILLLFRKPLYFKRNTLTPFEYSKEPKLNISTNYRFDNEEQNLT